MAITVVSTQTPYGYRYNYKGDVHLHTQPAGLILYPSRNLNFGLYHMRRWK
jgi:hypothetical protein